MVEVEAHGEKLCNNIIVSTLSSGPVGCVLVLLSSQLRLEHVSLPVSEILLYMYLNNGVPYLYVTGRVIGRHSWHSTGRAPRLSC